MSREMTQKEWILRSYLFALNNYYAVIRAAKGEEISWQKLSEIRNMSKRYPESS